MFFAIFMIVAAIAATILVGIFAGGVWGVMAFAAVILVIYRIFTHVSGPNRPLKRNALNAFQRALSDD
ncbi:hypothetical protein N9A67_03000 [Rhodobacteraceae bacterium]|nr:hypothetical protein [Paracoccaceae bacterium]